MTLHEPAEGGTQVTHRWHVEPHGPMKVPFPLIRRSLEYKFQADLDQMVQRLQERAL